MTWRLAPGLSVLRQQINAAAPARSRKMDGTVGDLRHQRGVSEHNPNARGVVRAMDITHDPAHGVDGDLVSADAIAELDRRGHAGYVIWDRRIRSTTVHPGVWRRYNGDNPHDHHVHISYVARYDDTRPWRLECFGRVVVNPTVPTVDAPAWPLPDEHLIFHDPKDRASWHDGSLDAGDQAGHDAILTWQRRMRDRGWDIDVDGFYGKSTEEVVVAFQGEKGLLPDGIIGPRTWVAAWESVVTR